jgi:hypothetical protein
VGPSQYNKNDGWWERGNQVTTSASRWPALFAVFFRVAIFVLGETNDLAKSC